MQMSKEEIVRRFKNMEGKENHRIDILAQLNGCKKSEIMAIIKTTPAPEEVINNEEEEKVDNDAVYNLVVNRLAELEAIIKQAEKEYKELSAFLKGEA